MQIHTHRKKVRGDTCVHTLNQTLTTTLTHALTHTHTHTHPYMHTHTHTEQLKQKSTRMFLGYGAWSRARCVYSTHSNTHTLSLSLSLPHSVSLTHSHTQTRTHTNTHIRPEKLKPCFYQESSWPLSQRAGHDAFILHPQIHTHTHFHTHTQTRTPFSLPPSLSLSDTLFLTHTLEATGANRNASIRRVRGHGTPSRVRCVHSHESSRNVYRRQWLDWK